MLIAVVATEVDSKTFDVRITSRICIKFPTVCHSNGIYCQEAMSRFASGITECTRPAVDVRERGKPAWQDYLSPFYRPFSRRTWVSRCLLKQRVMEVVVTTGLLELYVVQTPVKSSPPTNQHPAFLQAWFPSRCPTNSVRELKGKYHITWTCLIKAHLEVLQLCLWPLIAPGYLGEGCRASHQPSDVSTPCVTRLYNGNLGWMMKWKRR